MALVRFLIERDIPKAGSLDAQELKEAAVKSNEVLRQLGPDIQWVHSYIVRANSRFLRQRPSGA